MQTHYRRTVLGSIVGLCGLTGCLGGDTEQNEIGESTLDAAVPDEPVAAVAVSIDTGERLLDPPLVHLMRGGTVTWTNDGDSDRKIETIDGRIPADLDSKAATVPAGEAIEWTFADAGVYDCAVADRSTVGRVVVGEPHMQSEPAMNDGGELSGRPAEAFAALNGQTTELGGDADCGCPE